ncbi:MAG: AGE family epimerase/isomerase [Sedimentisphaerales bacterium]|jgi:mannobiose 2-epimerase|nr:AGE family epimerase/isomerase [Sedimentisphaerales bacterium]HNY76971.1 AGE family epimerase/isomerase [Sedimentisphaerales bacterium]HOC64694.1 AGE family epimerase/isomerase [Sedimentisphaerales bacterium]HOH62745.1 AGE family epimerase/isomerase [Sedimentisphaerales bacterium]HPY48477.1 AGE family epimerase/isomerase [Sedimentisphaerales bacterium]
MAGREIESFRRRVAAELHEDILPFWLEHCVDHEHGGFIGRMSNELSVDRQANKGLILNARLLWTFSTLCRSEIVGANDDSPLQLARRAYDYLEQHFWDDRFGGAFWQVDCRGALADDKKKIYGQAFYIYALSEYFLATGESAALERAQALFDLIEKHSCDMANGGYIETCNRDWTAAEDVRLSDKDLNEKKSMNNHLHLLEGYTNLYRAWPDPQVADELSGLIELFERHILDRDTSHFGHFFNERWEPRSDTYTFGHDIEGSWLLCEAAEVLGRPELVEKTGRLAVDIAQAVYEQGLDSDGGLFYEGKAGRVIDTNKEWWPQAEAVVGFLNACQLSGRAHFFEAALRCWEFIERAIVDHMHGEWFWRVDRNGTPDRNEPKVSEWKGPYHNTRACLETIRRLDAVAQGKDR